MSDRHNWWRNTVRKLAFRPRCEALEPRDVPAIITVTNTDDTPVIGSGSLRAAILEANATTGADSIRFAISGAGVQTIQPASALPPLLDDAGVFIDGWTQGGSGYAGPPLIEVDGSAAGVGAFGFTVVSDANTLRGLAVNRFDGFGIYVLGASGNLLLGNYVGTTAAGTAAAGNGGAGVVVESAVNTTIGGAGAAANVISGNAGDGVLLTGATGTALPFNFIGTDPAGAVAVPNGGAGVRVAADASGNTVGAEDGVNGNLISGNAGDGVAVAGTGNVVAGNFIGTNNDGDAALPNGGVGVRVTGAGNTVGSAAPNAGNVISGNAGDGVLLSGVSGTLVVGNYIGTDETGQFDLGNKGNGVVVTAGSTANTVGGTPGNVISGNDANGVLVSNKATLNTVSGNLIGLAADGVKSLGNTFDGVKVQDADHNLIGHADPVTGISYYDSTGVPTQPVSLWQGIRNSDLPNRYLISGTSGDNGLLFDGTIDGKTGTSFLVNYPNAATTSVYGPDNLSGNEVRLVGVYKNADAATAAVKVNGFLFNGTTTDLSNPANYRTVNHPGAEFNYVHSTMNGLAVGNYDSQPDHGTGGLPLGPGHAYIYDIATNTFLTDIVFPGSKSNTAYGIWYNGRTSYTICGGYSPDAVNNFDNQDRPIGQGYLVDYDSATGTFSNYSSFSYPFGTNFFTHFEGISSVEKGVYTLNADSGQAGSSNTVQFQGSFVTVRRNTDGSFGPAVWVNLNDPSFPSTALTSSNSVYGNQVVGIVFNGSTVVPYQATVNIAFQLSNVIAGNGGNGITLDAADDNQIAMNYVGTDKTGTLDRGNKGNGILVTNGSSNNLIGGEATGGNDPTAGVFVRPPQGNLISGNDANGVFITGNATGNQLSGNFIGTAASGKSAVGNALDGVAIVGANGNSLIGCTFQEDPFVFYNVISGNGGNGLRVTDSDDTTIQANFFGLGADNKTAVGNAQNGVLVNGTSARTTMGGPIPLGNVDAANGMNGIVVADTASYFISYNTFCGLAAFSDDPTLGNGLDGMLITATGGNILIRTNVITRNGDDGIEISGDATDVRVVGNIIGLNTNGMIPMGNLGNGVEVGGTAHNIVIGGPQPTFNVIPQNAISANGGNGVAVVGSANNVTINNSYIGTDIGGKAARPNKAAGISVGPGTSAVTVGSPDPTLVTLVSGNFGNGVELQGTHGNTVIGSLIGVAADGTTPIGNGGVGVLIAGGATGNTVGGGGAFSDGTGPRGNLISGNAGAGVAIVGAGTSGNLVTGNFIGTGPTGQTALANGGAGVLVQDAPGNTIGSRVPARAANVISGNAGDGVRITGAGATGNVVLGNSIGVDRTASFAVGNGGDGVRVEGADGTTIGGTTPNSTNIIGGNAGVAVRLLAGADNSEVSNNYLGLDLSQTAAIPNLAGGVVIDASSNNTVGGVVADSDNFISGNTGAGVRIANGSSGNLIAGNLIGTDGAGTAGVPNLVGVFIAASANNTVQSNVIAFNAGTGVVVGSSPADVTAVGNRVTTNSIFLNAGLAIDLGNNGPTPNGVNPRAFPNRGQNYPVLTLAGTINGTATVVGTFQSIPNTTFRLEFFANAGGTQAQTFVGDLVVTTDANGFAAVRFSTANPTALGGAATLTATATNVATGDTSEVSNAVAVPVLAAVTLSPPTLPAAVAGTTYSQQLTASGGAGGPYTFAVTAGALPPGLTLSTGGAVSGTPTAAGSFPFVVTATDPLGNAGQQVYALLVNMSPPPPPPPVHLLAVGTGAGGGPRVVVYNPDRTIRFDFFAFDVDFRGGVTVATGDITGDGIDDIVAGAGDGGGPEVRVFDGATGTLLSSFFAYDPGFRNGLNVAVGDVTGDGTPDIVTGAGPGGAAHVKMFDGRTGAEVRSFFAFDPAFRGGATVAAGDTTGDGAAEIIAGAAAGGGPRVEVYDGRSNALLQSFFAYASTFTGGVFVAAGDLTGDGLADILTGPGVGGGPLVVAFDGPTLGQIFSVELQQVAAAGGATVAAWDFDADGTASAVGGGGPGGLGRVVVLGPDGATLFGLLPFGEFLGGAFVG